MYIFVFCIIKVTIDDVNISFFFNSKKKLNERIVKPRSNVSIFDQSNWNS